MKYYTITAEMIQHYETQIEANSEEEAWEIAKNLDGSLFSELEGCSEWNVHDVVQED